MPRATNWPKDGSPTYARALIDEIVEAIRFAYKLERQNLGKSIPLHGPDAPESALAPSGSFVLKAGRLKEALEDQGSDALEVIVAVALRLGIEQGRRIAMSPGGEAHAYIQGISHIAREIKLIRELSRP